MISIKPITYVFILCSIFVLCAMNFALVSDMYNTIMYEEFSCTVTFALPPENPQT